jgi:hypothetical protein
MSISGNSQGIGSTRDEIIVSRGKDYNSNSSLCIVYAYKIERDGELHPYQVLFYFDKDGICWKYVNYLPSFMMDETVKTLNKDYDMLTNTSWRDNIKSYTHSIELNGTMFVYEVKFETLKDAMSAPVPRKDGIIERSLERNSGNKK